MAPLMNIACKPETDKTTTLAFPSKALQTAISAAAIVLASAVVLPINTIAAPAKPAAKTEKEKEKPAEKKESSKPEPVIENVQSVTPDQLIEKPHEYLNKNVRFTANFYAFSSLALDYKPAMRASKQYLSFLVTKETSKVPLSEIKLAYLMPKENDEKENKLLTQLKEGDQVEITGKVFNTALDDPWLDVLKLKKLKSAPEHDDKDKDKKASADDKDKDKDKKAGDTEPEVKK
jgi:hypothetical protein